MKENCDDTPRKLHERTNMGRLLPKPGFRYSEKGGVALWIVGSSLVVLIPC